MTGSVPWAKHYHRVAADAQEERREAVLEREQPCGGARTPDQYHLVPRRKRAPRKERDVRIVLELPPPREPRVKLIGSNCGRKKERF